PRHHQPLARPQHPMSGPGPDRLDDVFAHVDANRDVFVERLAAWVRTPSVSATGQGMPSAAGHARALGAAAGLEAEVAGTAGWPLVLGHRPGPPGAPTVLVYGHYDGQPPDPLDAWTSPPFEPEGRAGRLYGRGGADKTGQHPAPPPGAPPRSSPRPRAAACTAAVAPTTRASTWPSSWPWRACWPPGASCRARSRCCWTARRRSAPPPWPPSPPATPPR